jgi:hypothetical protein
LEPLIVSCGGFRPGLFWGCVKVFGFIKGDQKSSGTENPYTENLFTK